MQKPKQEASEVGPGVMGRALEEKSRSREQMSPEARSLAEMFDQAPPEDMPDFMAGLAFHELCPFLAFVGF